MPFWPDGRVVKAYLCDSLYAVVPGRHNSTCRLSYCLRTKKGAEPSCRFFYPRPLTERPVVTKEINHRDYMFAPARNQAILNQCSPVVTMGWMANDTTTIKEVVQ